MPTTDDKVKVRNEKARKARLVADPKAAQERKAQLKAAKKKYEASDKGREQKREARREARTAFRKLRRKLYDKRPFVGVDGEGIGRGADHRYVLFRMGKRELYAADRRLTCGAILAFILDHDPRDILVAFAFEYDVTKIFAHDTPAKRLMDMIQAYQQPITIEGETVPAASDNRKRRPYWTWLATPQGKFGVNWLPRNHVKVCRDDPQRPGRALPGSTRTIYDTWGFFACSFQNAIGAWGVGDDRRELIDLMKPQRAHFDAITQPIRDYCALECDLLAELMTEFREACLALDLTPRTWNGAGKLASAMLKGHGVMTRKEVEKLVPTHVLDMAHVAYYGGRFELMRSGAVNLPVTEHDINSAYPAAMRSLPCLVHGSFRKASAAELASVGDEALYVCPVRFSHSRDQFICGLPFRDAKSGRLKWPRNGNGVYWSMEINSAVRLGAVVERRAGYLYEKKCDCRPFDWIEERYRERKALPGMRGEPIKRAINSIYGKLAQRIGEPPFANPIWAGIITAMTRAALNDAALAAGPRTVIMIATDALYTVNGAIGGLDKGEGLGQWGVKSYPSLFVVQPGLYWPPPPPDWKPGAKRTLKSRGLSAKFFADHTQEFEDAWSDFAAGRRSRPTFWEDKPLPVPLNVELFVGLRIAMHWGKPEKAGQWISQPRNLKFDWDAKRGRHEWSPDRSHVILEPLNGDVLSHSARYTPAGRLVSPDALDWNESSIELEAMPDPLDLTPPFVE